MLSKKLIPYAAVMLAVVLTALMLLSYIRFEAAAVAVTGVSGVEVTVDGNGSISESSGTVTVTAKGSFTSSKTATITVTNTSGSTANISFDYSGTQVGGCSLGGVSSNKCSGTKTVLLTAGSTTTFTITSRSWNTNTTVTMKLSNFKVEAVAAESNVTVTYGNLGSVTVAGKSAASGSQHSIDSSDGAALVATPVSGATFVGWIDTSDSSVVSTAASFTYRPTEDTVLEAAFASSSTDAWFSVLDNSVTYLYNDLNKANAKAKVASSKTIVLAANGTLPAGTYTIGDTDNTTVNLLIPYNSANTLCTTAPTVNDSAVVAPTAYRTLNMASNAKIIVNGGLSIAGSQTAAYPVNGQVTGPVGVITMNTDSNITVNNGGSLYAWGYVAGTGTVTIESGGKVYEDFQVADYRGGDVTSTLSAGTNTSTWHIFPMSQYYVQNIQVPMTLKAGAEEYGYFSVTASLMGIKSETVNFIGENSLFQITNGHVIKDYDEKTDRLVIDVHGTMEVNPFSIEIQVKGFSSAITINSANYDLPLNSNITINLVEGSTVDLNQDLLMLPGSVINIGEKATLNVKNGKRLIVYDRDQWINGRSGETTTSLYCSDLNKSLVQLKNVFNGTKGAAPVTRGADTLVDAKVIVNGMLNASAGYLYTTADGGNIYSTGAGRVIMQTNPAANAYQIEQRRNGNDDFVSSTELDTHPLASALLKNGDGNYLHTSVSATSTTYTYCADCMAWQTLVSYHATNVELGNNLNMHFAFSNDSFTTAKVVHMYADGKTETFTFTKDDTSVAVVRKDGTTETINLAADAWTTVSINDQNYYVIVYTGLAAKEMCDTVSVTLYDADGNAIDAWCDSIRSYAGRIYSRETLGTNLKAVIETMLNYGAACQKQFSYRCDSADDLANSVLPESARIDYGTKSSNQLEAPDPSAAFGIHAYNLTIDSNIQFYILLNGVAEGVTVQYWFKGHKGNDEGTAVTPKTATVTNNGILVENLVVADYMSTIYIKYGDGDPVETTINVYLENNQSLAQNVFHAFQAFAAAAKEYLHNRGT